MNVTFSQIYVEPGVEFPFSFEFQHYLSKEISALVVPSAKFTNKCGGDFELSFNISAKTALQDNEIRGPAVYRKTKTIEYTVFLPFDTITRGGSVLRSAVEFLLKGICSVLDGLFIDKTGILKRQDSLIERICTDPNMVESPDEDW